MNMNLKINSNIIDRNTDVVKQAIERYVKSLTLPDFLREKILCSDFIQNNPSFYIDYPFLFIKDVTEFENKRSCLINLSIAGALYYQSIIFLDRVLDKDSSCESFFPIIMICQEETIKLLMDFFPRNSGFWKIWNKRKLEYLRAFKTDKAKKIHSFEEFENHADDKSSLGKLAIDSLFFMGVIETEEQYNLCLEIHKYFYCAFQILDDISDIREDFLKEQFNIAIWLLSQEIEKGYISESVLVTPEKVSETFYTKSLYSILFKKAANYLNTALLLSNQLNLKYMENEVYKLWNTIVIQNLNIKTYLYEIKIANHLSNIRANYNNIEENIKRGVLFIKNEQREDGRWLDYCNNAGYSDSWCSAFILVMMKEAGISNDSIEKGKCFLSKIKKRELWGYSDNWICDNDSSFFATYATNDHAALEILIERFNNDGGVATYYNKQALVYSLSTTHEIKVDVGPWLKSHPCVSSVALFVLSRMKVKSKKLRPLLDYFKRLIEKDKPLVYWWIDDIYTLFFLAKANTILKDEIIDQFIKRKSKEKLMKLKMSKDKGEITVFYLSMLLHLLIYTDMKEEAKHIVDMILKLQYVDGSWSESNFMCMPAVDCLTPENPFNWKVEDRGMDVRAHEFHRLFTTSLSVMALSEFLSYER